MESTDQFEECCRGLGYTTAVVQAARRVFSEAELTFIATEFRRVAQPVNNLQDLDTRTKRNSCVNMFGNILAGRWNLMDEHLHTDAKEVALAELCTLMNEQMDNVYQ